MKVQIILTVQHITMKAKLDHFTEMLIIKPIQLGDHLHQVNATLQKEKYIMTSAVNIVGFLGILSKFVGTYQSNQP